MIRRDHHHHTNTTSSSSISIGSSSSPTTTTTGVVSGSGTGAAGGIIVDGGGAGTAAGSTRNHGGSSSTSCSSSSSWWWVLRWFLWWLWRNICLRVLYYGRMIIAFVLVHVRAQFVILTGVGGVTTTTATTTLRRKRCTFRRMLVLCLLLLMVIRNLQQSSSTTANNKRPSIDHHHDNKNNNKKREDSNSSSSCTLRHRSYARGVQDIQRCYSSEQVRRLPPDCLASPIDDWTRVQKCLSGRFDDNDNPVDADHNNDNNDNEYEYEIHVIGERHSGTKFLVEKLQTCFQRVRRVKKVHRDYLRSKHFFQPISIDDDSNNNSNSTSTRSTTNTNTKKSIIVALFRDPVEWVAAMHEKPYHSPNHIQKFETGTDNVVPMSSWKDFVTSYWLTKRSDMDLELIQKGQQHSAVYKNKCAGIEKFNFDEVVPCLFDTTTNSNNYNNQQIIPDSKLRGFVPIYELKRDGSGKPFQNILELRTEKIVNFLLEIPMLLHDPNLAGYVPVRYEDLVTNGTDFLFQQLASIMGLDKLPAVGCATDTTNNDSGQQDSAAEHYLHPRYIPKDFRRWIIDHMDHNVEKLLGYDV